MREKKNRKKNGIKEIQKQTKKQEKSSEESTIINSSSTITTYDMKNKKQVRRYLYDING